MVDDFFTRGWLAFPREPAVELWARQARAEARHAPRDPALAQWHVCEGTWFVGIDALPNDAQGRVKGSDPLSGAAMTFAHGLAGPLPQHRGQVSAVYPGYPRPREGESAGAFRYRRDRDAAQVDGLKPVGPARRRMIREPHAFILGLPLTDCSPEAAPLVVWEGSHEVIRAALAAALEGHNPADWPDIDVTEAYHDARRQVFDSCRRVLVHARPGEAYVIHRLALHGVAPWGDGAVAPEDGRAIVYFRPLLPGGAADWLRAP